MGSATRQENSVANSNGRTCVVGDKFFYLTVIDQPKVKGKNTYVNCRCDCGAVRNVRLVRLLDGVSRSCGCKHKEYLRQKFTTHGKYFEPEYRAWSNMKKRCTDPRLAKWYSNISVCEKWLNSYDAFLADVGRKPSEKHTLDRIDSAGNYEPTNVRWVTMTVQSRNTKTHCTNKTGIRGVSWSKAKNKWRAAIYVNNKQKHVGYFDSIEDAKLARKEAEVKYWSETK